MLETGRQMPSAVPCELRLNAGSQSAPLSAPSGGHDCCNIAAINRFGSRHNAVARKCPSGGSASGSKRRATQIARRARS